MHTGCEGYGTGVLEVPRALVGDEARYNGPFVGPRGGGQDRRKNHVMAGRPSDERATWEVLFGNEDPLVQINAHRCQPVSCLRSSRMLKGLMRG